MDTRRYSETTAREIETAVRSLVHTAFKRADPSWRPIAKYWTRAPRSSSRRRCCPGRTSRG